MNSVRLMRWLFSVLLMSVMAKSNLSAQQIQSPASVAPPLTAETADEIVRAMYSDFGVPPDSEISLGQPAISQFTGYDRIPITVKISTMTQSVDLLVSRDRKTIVRYSTLDLTKDDPLRGVEISRTLGWGNPDAPVQIVAFMDLQCPFCADMHKEFMTSTLDHYKDTIWITYKSFPLESHDKAMSFAKETECIGEQSVAAYKSYVDALYRPSPQDSNATLDFEVLAANIVQEKHLDAVRLHQCLSDQKTALAIERARQEGTTAGTVATPTFFVNGERVRGALSQAALWKVIDRAKQNYDREHRSTTASSQPDAGKPTQ